MPGHTQKSHMLPSFAKNLYPKNQRYQCIPFRGIKKSCNLIGWDYSGFLLELRGLYKKTENCKGFRFWIPPAKSNNKNLWKLNKTLFWDRFGPPKFIWKIHFCNFFVSKFLPLRRQRGGRVEDGWRSMDEGPMEQGMKDQWNKDRRKDYRKVYRAREMGTIEKICYRQ